MSDLSPSNSELVIQLRSRLHEISTRATITLTTARFTTSAALGAFALGLERYSTLFRVRVLNFSQFNMTITFSDQVPQSLALRVLCPSVSLVQARNLFVVLIVVLFGGQKVLQLLSGRVNPVQIATTFLTVSTCFFNNPLRVIHSFWPSATWILVDEVFKCGYLAYLLFYGLRVFEHLRMGRSQSRVVAINPYLAVGFFVARIANMYWALPDIVIAMLLGVYGLVFVVNALQIYQCLEASSAYAFWTYCGLAAVVAAVFAGLARIKDLLVQYTLPFGVVNALAMLMERAHSDARQDQVDWADPVKQLETRLEASEASDGADRA